MNPKHIQLNVDPKTGDIWLMIAKPGEPRRRIKEMTNELLMCLCADISAAIDEGEGIKAIERSVSFADGMECRVSVELVKNPVDDTPSPV